ncbi:hypothetical protein HNY73_009384 [Argiope bruennichi]|uniref:Integrase catalytic domain-containing protein n=1 Tax=Argiope bruennichi TaxID=94029 RepID=A0A8T0F9C8_ARGBR|nr:hypothetical protein HNY73_009384 [Argiope bruennichi]
MPNCQPTYCYASGLLQQLPIPSNHLGKIVSADHIICLPETRNGNTNMLVQIDHATRYVIATPSASLAAHTVTDALYHNKILRYGPHVTARHTQRFLQKYGITQSTTPPYSPQANSIVERANGIIEISYCNDWPKKGDHKLSPIFKRTICDYTSSRASVLRDQVYNTTEQIYQGCPRTTSPPYFKRIPTNHRGKQHDEENGATEAIIKRY